MGVIVTQDDTVLEIVDEELVDSEPDEHIEAEGERVDEEQGVEVTEALGERDPLVDLLGEVDDEGHCEVEAVWEGERDRDRVTEGDFDLLPEVVWVVEDEGDGEKEALTLAVAVNVREMVILKTTEVVMDPLPH